MSTFRTRNRKYHRSPSLCSFCHKLNT